MTTDRIPEPDGFSRIFNVRIVPDGRDLVRLLETRCVNGHVHTHGGGTTGEPLGRYLGPRAIGACGSTGALVLPGDVPVYAGPRHGREVGAVPYRQLRPGPERDALLWGPEGRP